MNLKLLNKSQTAQNSDGIDSSRMNTGHGAVFVGEGRKCCSGQVCQQKEKMKKEEEMRGAERKGEMSNRA